MIILDHRKARQPLKVWLCGDWHISSISHHSALFEKHFNRAVKEQWTVMHIGDALEMVTASSKVAQRGALRDQTADPETQRQTLITHLKKLKGGTILPGNHEFRIDAVTGLDFMQSIVDAVGPSFQAMDSPGMIDVRVGKQSYVFYAHHGEGPVAAVTTLFDRLQRDTEGLDAIVCGHVHAGTFDPAIKMTPTGHRTVFRYRVGHYLLAPKYALVRPVSRIGACGSWLLTLDPNTHSITSEWLQ